MTVWPSERRQVEVFCEAWQYHRRSPLNGNVMETLLTKAQKLIALVLSVLLIVVVALSTVDLGVLIAHEIWKPPRFLIRVQGAARDLLVFLAGPYWGRVTGNPEGVSQEGCLSCAAGARSGFDCDGEKGHYP